MNNKAKIIFVGMPDMALVCLSALLEKKFNIVGVVPPDKTHVTYSGFVEYCKNKGLNVIDFKKNPNEPTCIQKIKELQADIGVVCSYNYKLSKEFLLSTRLGYINCHPSLLPDYRGGMPYFHIIKNGEKISAITLHFMDENFDTGDIIYQEQFDILPWENMGTLFNRTNFMISDALVKVLSDFETGADFKRIKQPVDKNFKKAPKVDNDIKINWNKKAEEISCLIRACNPFFSAVTNYRNTYVKILKAHPVEGSHNLKCGQIARADKDNLLVACSDGYLSLDILQLSTWGIFNPMEFFFTFTPTTNEYFK